MTQNPKWQPLLELLTESTSPGDLVVILDGVLFDYAFLNLTGEQKCDNAGNKLYWLWQLRCAMKEAS